VSALSWLIITGDANIAGARPRPQVPGPGRCPIAFEYHPGDEINDPDALFTTRFLYAFRRLCAQDIAQVDDVPPGHGARVLAEADAPFGETIR
jgi:hypothetical protein